MTATKSAALFITTFTALAVVIAGGVLHVLVRLFS